MKIHIPKNHKILPLEIPVKNNYSSHSNIYLNNNSNLEVNNKNSNHIVNAWEYELLLPRNSILKLIKKNKKILQSEFEKTTFSLSNKESPKKKTRIYEFEYMGYINTPLEIKPIHINYTFNKSNYSNELKKEVEDELNKPQNNDLAYPNL